MPADLSPGAPKGRRSFLRSAGQLPVKDGTCRPIGTCIQSQQLTTEGKVSITNSLFRAARLSATMRAFSSGSPRRIVRRTKNIVVGRSLGKAGVWRGLYGGGRPESERKELL
jgi:hypothetical protein